jgi:crotonobetainyl-CoA:carnitine CoA-transferase CaiB-like acyl-CoA transferase
VETCVAAFTRANVPCGPVYAVGDLMRDETLQARNAIVRCPAPAGSVVIPGALLHGSPAGGIAPGTPVKREPPRRWMAEEHAAARPALHGLRVLEMGNYTTAPLAARQLGALGADVVKLEPPSGELSRASPPHRDGQSYFCTLSNSDKRSVVIDLASSADRALFHGLLARADVFVENMKPGVLARYGYGADELRQRYPSLVYCSVSGFGADTPLAGRPAMDATIQGMAGVMDLTRSSGVPYKVGASICDILGGEFALLAVLAGLEFRARTGRGTLIDLSMQELAAWLTQLEWNGGGYRVPVALLAARDGHVVAIGSEAAGQRAAEAAEMSRDEMVAALTARGLRAAPLHSVSEAAHLDQVAARALVTTGDDRRGVAWPLLACPIRLPDVPRVERRAIGRVGEDRSDVLRDWGIEREKAGT